MKKILMVLAATVICGACLFTSCKKDEDLKLEEKIIGKWMLADKENFLNLMAAHPDRLKFTMEKDF